MTMRNEVPHVPFLGDAFQGKRKGAIHPAVAVVALLLVVAVAMQGGLFQASIVLPGTSCTLIKPQYGRMECQQVSPETSLTFPSYSVGATGQRDKSGTLLPANSHYILDRCGDLENTPNCAFLIKATQYDRVVVHWRVFRPDNPPAGGYSTLTTSRTELLVSNTQLGDYIEIYAQPADNDFGAKLNFDLIQRFVPYGLRAYDSGRVVQYSSTSCNVFTIPAAEKVVIGQVPDGTLTRTVLGNDIRATGTLPFNDAVNWLAGYVFAPGNDRSIVQYQGQDAYCNIDTVYSLNRIDTDKGCYIDVNSRIASVTCCPGMQSANAYCGDDFAWHVISQPTCNSNADCPSGYTCQNPGTPESACVLNIGCVSVLECPGQGNFIPDYSTPENDIIRYACVNQCMISERKAVQCTPPNVGCASGYVCDTRSYTCVLQSGPEIRCGDGVCSRPYEDFDNCPADCDAGAPPGAFDIAGFVISFIIIFIIALVVLMLLAFFTPLRFLRVNIKMLIAVAALIGLVIAILVSI